MYLIGQTQKVGPQPERCFWWLYTQALTARPFRLHGAGPLAGDRRRYPMRTVIKRVSASQPISIRRPATPSDNPGLTIHMPRPARSS